MDNSSTGIAEQKLDLRERFRRYRASLSDDEYERLSRSICARAWDLPVIRAARLAHVYWPLIHRREVDTRPLIKRMREKGMGIVLPVVQTFGVEADADSRMKHLLWDPDEPLRPNGWGVHEPERGHAVPPEAVDVVIVPAIGAGRNGHRIGHGFGYYDEFLAMTQATRVGLVYDGCITDRVPHAPHDVPLDLIVTESNVWNPALL